MSSLNAAYTFNDNTGYVYDYSGNNITLTPASGLMTISATTSPAGAGYDCSMSQNCTGSLFRPMGAYTGLTVFAYIKYNGTPGGTNIIVEYSTAFSVAINSSGNIIFVTKDGTTHTLTSAGTLTSGNWYTISCTWNDDGAGAMRIYVNGVVDANTLVGATALNNTSSSLVMGVVGTGPSYSLINTLEVRSSAFNISQVLQLEANPGGGYYQSMNSFAVGDVIADENQVNQAIVTWVADNSGFYAYPITSCAGGDYSRYGNVYNTNRQYFFQFNKDFDGNGNEQMTVMWPITNFLDYATPSNTQTIWAQMAIFVYLPMMRHSHRHILR